MDCLLFPFILLEEAVSWTQRFLTRKIWPINEVYLWQTNLKANVCRNSKFQVNRTKNATWRRRLISRNRITIFSALHAKNDTTNLFGYKLGESTENNKRLLFFSGKETIQTFNGSIKAITLLFVKWLTCELQCLKILLNKDLFLNFRVIWSVNQIVLFNGFLSDFVEITSCVYTKTRVSKR